MILELIRLVFQSLEHEFLFVMRRIGLSDFHDLDIVSVNLQSRNDELVSIVCLKSELGRLEVGISEPKRNNVVRAFV